MTEQVKVIVGRDAQDVATAFLDTWRRAETGEAAPARVLSFETWEGVASLTPDETTWAEAVRRLIGLGLESVKGPWRESDGS